MSVHKLQNFLWIKSLFFVKKLHNPPDPIALAQRVQKARHNGGTSMASHFFHECGCLLFLDYLLYHNVQIAASIQNGLKSIMKVFSPLNFSLNTLCFYSPHLYTFISAKVLLWQLLTQTDLGCEIVEKTSENV